MRNHRIPKDSLCLFWKVSNVYLFLKTQGDKYELFTSFLQSHWKLWLFFSLCSLFLSFCLIVYIWGDLISCVSLFCCQLKMVTRKVRKTRRAMKEHQMATMKGETLMKTAEKVSDNDWRFVCTSFLGELFLGTNFNDTRSNPKKNIMEYEGDSLQWFLYK